MFNHSHPAMMTALLGLTAACALSTTATALAEEALEPLETVEYVDLERYTGLWYEIATIPSLFEAGCTGTTATYWVRDDGDIGVLNSCNMFWLGGRERSIEGSARVVDEESGAKLAVTFGGAPSAANYWIIDLDTEGYQWAAVGEPSRDYYWILARTPTIDDALFDDLIERAAEHGYDVSRIEETRQTRR